MMEWKRMVKNELKKPLDKDELDELSFVLTQFLFFYEPKESDIILNIIKEIGKLVKHLERMEGIPLKNWNNEMNVIMENHIFTILKYVDNE